MKIFNCFLYLLFIGQISVLGQAKTTPPAEMDNLLQKERLARDYYKRGEYQKALITYQNLLKKKPYTFKYVYSVIDAYQQLERYTEAQSFIEENLAKFKSPALLIELGYNYQLQNNQQRADELYTEAIESIDQNPSFVYSLTRRFELHSLLDQAIEAYLKASVLMPDKNFNIQMARLYGEQGKIEDMFSNYLQYITFQPNFINNAKRAFNEFISDDPEDENNQILRKLLLKRIQSQPDAYNYELLSWLYVQQKEYSKSFVQEKALYKRNPESLERIFELAIFALEDSDDATAQRIFNYILDTAQDAETQLAAHQYILEIQVDNATPEQLQTLDLQYQELFKNYGINESTLSLQLSYAEFLAFNINDTEQASDVLKKALKLNISPYQEGLVKLKLGDILVLQERFNEALIYFSQIQANLKNSTLSQEARFKVAKTSYYKGDFDWAESQLKILKSSTSQLIANDALDLKLLISDNKYEDSTRTALKLYAKADLLDFQNKTNEAITLLDQILEEHEGESIVDETLYKQAELFKKTGSYEAASENYLRIIADYREGILIDDAYYQLAELYRIQLDRAEEAKSLYEKIIFEHEDSIYFVESRKQYRRLRGDDIE